MSGSRPPDVVGQTLEDALQAIVAAGWKVGEIIETSPPRRTLGDPRRVVRERMGADGSVDLVVCGERSDGARA
jgi:hypothetical protein